MPGITARFDLEFPFQSLEISIEKSKNWNGNSMTKRAIFPVFGLSYPYLIEFHIYFYKKIYLY